MRTAIFIVNYNMPERTDAMVEFIEEHVNALVDVFVIDNGSDIAPQSKYTSLRIEKNAQTTAGWLLGLEWADIYSQLHGYEYFAYWFLITSAEFVGTADPLTPMLEFLKANKDAAGIHPALTQDSTTSWEHLKQRGSGVRQTWMIDNIASLYRASWFDAIERFDPELRYAWGIDLETCWKARFQDKTLWVNEEQPVKKVTNIGYTMNRMGMTAKEREQRAGQNMADVLHRKYGPDWWQRMTNEYVEERMK